VDYPDVKKGCKVRILWPPYCRDMSPCGQLSIKRDKVVVELMHNPLFLDPSDLSRVRVRMVGSSEIVFVDLEDLLDGELVNDA
jgi:hypothetical protein